MRRLSNDWRESVAAESDAKRQKGDENAMISAVTDGLHEPEDPIDPEFGDDKNGDAVFDYHAGGTSNDVRKDVVDIACGKDTELDHMDYFGLYEAVPRLRARSHKIMKARLVLDRRGPSEWRCRWVVKDFKSIRPSQHAAGHRL